MDNPLTPNKIQRLIHLAEDKSFTVPRRLLLNSNDEDSKCMSQPSSHMSKSNVNYESSSGILDLERVEGFGESGIGNISLSKSTAFNPGEMTGRSTGTDDINPSSGLGPVRTFEEYGRHSLTLDNITSQMDKQTSEINDIMRHSIASNYSFHSKRDLTADEASLIIREAPIPVQQSTQVNFADSMTMNSSNISVGAYFKNRCPEFGKILSKTDSPDRSMMPSITEVSSHTPFDTTKDLSQVYNVDQTLDCVPVRQPRNLNNHNASTMNQLTKNYDTSYASSKIDREAKPSNIRPGPSVSKTDPKVNQMSAVTLSSMPPPQFQQKSFMTSSKPTDVLLKNLHSSFRVVTDDTEGTENSLSISKIADYLGKQSNVSITDMLQMHKPKSQAPKKPPLTELHMNMQEKIVTKDVQVTTLKDSRRMDAASSAGTTNTVISLDKLKINEGNTKEVPTVLVTHHTLNQTDIKDDDVKSERRTTRSKSPSSKSHSTLSTVQEVCTSFKSADSPTYTNKGEAKTPHVPSPNIEYRELDKSVDWHEVLLQKRLKQEGLVKEQWADIATTPVKGYVGVSCAVTISVTTLTDSWLTAKFQFDELPYNQDLTIELPRLPILLSPGKTENFILHLTSNVEINTVLPFTMLLKDASIDGEMEQKGCLEVNFKMPVIQAMSCDGINKVTFPPTLEKLTVTKSFVIISDCPDNLQLDLSIVDGDMFSIKSVQEIKKNEVNKVLTDSKEATEGQTSKSKSKGMNKQLCRLTSGNAIKVTVTFVATKLNEQQMSEGMATFNGLFTINMIGSNTILRKVDLIGSVGCVNLVLKMPNNTGNKLQLTNEVTSVAMCNTGSLLGVWVVKLRNISPGESIPFKISPMTLEIRSGGVKNLNLAYTGSDTNVCEATVILEDISSGKITSFDICGGTDRPKSFPLKTNYNNMSWVRSGRKEISLKNSSDKKIHIRCQIVGEGFSIDLPGFESRGIYCLPFSPGECRPLPLIFAPNTLVPHTATLHLVYDKNSDFSRKVKLYGCASGDGMRWSGLVTYGDTALVRAVSRAPIDLKLYNKTATPAFVAARVHFNLQYMSACGSARLVGGSRVVPGRGYHVVSLRVDWAKLEKRARATSAATALATLTVLTGAEFTRRRILKVLRDEANGELDTSLLPDNLKILAGPFEGEDLAMDNHLTDFAETKASLNELIDGLQELTAQIDLPQDFADENTIIITDDTVLEHHTLCD